MVTYVAMNNDHEFQHAVRRRDTRPMSRYLCAGPGAPVKVFTINITKRYSWINPIAKTNGKHMVPVPNLDINIQSENHFSHRCDTWHITNVKPIFVRTWKLINGLTHVINDCSIYLCGIWMIFGKFLLPVWTLTPGGSGLRQCLPSVPTSFLWPS